MLSMSAASNRVLMVIQFAGFPHNYGDRVVEVVLVRASLQCHGNLPVVSSQYLRFEFLGSLPYPERFSSGSSVFPFY